MQRNRSSNAYLGPHKLDTKVQPGHNWDHLFWNKHDRLLSNARDFQNTYSSICFIQTCMLLIKIR
jgi:hypothetical protein